MYNHVIVNIDAPVDIIQINNPIITRILPEFYLLLAPYSKKNPVVINNKETIVITCPICNNGFLPNRDKRKLTNIDAINITANNRTGIKVFI